ncbi:GntR family transcriptional regulator [uncultured Oscillibacter sp.]|uniref:FadR/GntR family transcriptional regulator n=1 Tax=uncultured Oscillibacter sp. TaxID=876091 RepID=UPI0028061D0D|nr:GntR family transcriptional regulator [uncultured Oscillibacter sp.]
MAIEVAALKKVTLTEQIMQQLTEQIRSGAVKPGERLPSERELAAMMHVSRGRVREALRALSLIGLVTIKPGGGVFACEQDSTFSEETVTWLYYQEINNVDEVYAARELIESAVYMDFFRQRTPAILQELHVYMDRITDASKSDISALAFYQLLVDMDMFVAQHCKNRIFFKLMQMIVLLRKETSLKILRAADLRENSAAKRQKIVDAIESGDAKRVERALKTFYKQSCEEFARL